MIRVACTCGKKFRGPDGARGRTIKCTGCGKSISVPGDSPIVETRSLPPTAAQQMASGVGAEAAARGSLPELWAALRRRAFHLEFVPPPEHVRRCMRCSATTFDVPGACPKCGSATVGIRLADVNSGRDRAWLVAMGAIGAARRRLSLFRRCAWAVAIAGAIGLGAWLGTNGALTAGKGFLLALGALFAAAAASWGALILARRALEVLHPVLRGGASPDGADDRLVAQVEERFLIPFIQRHSMYRESAELIPPEELDMLVTLVGRQGLALRREHIYEFLAALALRADYQEFKGEYLRFELSNPDTFEVYASLYPEASSDGSRLPFLQQYLEEGARRPDTATLRAKIDTIRREKKLATFQAELDKKAKVDTSQTVVLEQVDRIAPANFQLLAGLMYQAQGYVVHGMQETVDRPPVSVAEKGGEKTIVLARLAKDAVGDAPVRDLADARDYFRCAKAVLLTNASFSPAARKAASELDVTLSDRETLRSLIDAFNAAPREFARLTLILKSWQPEGVEELMTFEVISEAPKPRPGVATIAMAPPPAPAPSPAPSGAGAGAGALSEGARSAPESKGAMSYDEADDLMALLKKRAKDREPRETTGPV